MFEYLMPSLLLRSEPGTLLAQSECAAIRAQQDFGAAQRVPWGVSESGFDVALIPHTLAETTLGDRRPGDRLNLEADVLGKYVKRYLQRVLPETAPSGKS